SRQQFGSLPSNITGMAIDLTQYVSAPSWGQFRRTGKLTVTIDQADTGLLNYSNVLSTRVGLRLQDGTGEPTILQATITHEGRSLIYDQAGQAHTFTHVPIAIPYEKRNGNIIVDGTVASTAGDYEGLSPYGPWTLQINATDDGFLARVSKMALVF